MTTSASTGLRGLTAKPRPTATDRLRQVAVTISEILCVLGTLVGVGVFGERVQESSGGALSATATLIAPAGPAFSIWSVIYAGLAAYTVWQWSPRAAALPRNRSVGWLIAGSMLLNATWLLVTQAGWLWASVAVIVALAVVLGLALRGLAASPPANRVEAVVLDGTLGLYLGWVAVATCANITATLVAEGVRLSAGWAETAAVIVLLVAGGLGVVLARAFGGRLSVAVAMAWGLAWIAVGRTLTEPRSIATALVALVAAAVTLAAALTERRRRGGG